MAQAMVASRRPLNSDVRPQNWGDTRVNIPRSNVCASGRVCSVWQHRCLFHPDTPWRTRAVHTGWYSGLFGSSLRREHACRRPWTYLVRTQYQHCVYCLLLSRHGFSKQALNCGLTTHSSGLPGVDLERTTVRGRLPLNSSVRPNVTSRTRPRSYRRLGIATGWL